MATGQTDDKSLKNQGGSNQGGSNQGPRQHGSDSGNPTKNLDGMKQGQTQNAGKLGNNPDDDADRDMNAEKKDAKEFAGEGSDRANRGKTGSTGGGSTNR